MLKGDLPDNQRGIVLFIHTTKKKCSLMDKNLKKLSRVQLLQLMVQLSEDRDALAAENAELRKRAEERPPAATSMKVGSIAEAALQANGYFESAQNAADEYLREIKRMRDQVASRVNAASASQAQQAQASQAQVAQRPVRQAQPLERTVPEVKSASAQAVSAEQQQQIDQVKAAAVQEARAMSDRVLARANAQAKAVIDDAQARADAIIVEANRRSHTIITRANRQAEAVLGAAKQKATVQEAAQQEPAMQQASLQQGAVQNQPSKTEATSTVAAAAGSAAQQQVSARKTSEAMKSPSTTAEIAMRARHVRTARAEG